MAYDLATLGVDIRDLWREGSGVTPRYVLMLVGHLPETSATKSAMRGGPEFRPWSTETHLLAGVVNLLYAANRQRGGKTTRTPLVEPPKARTKKTRTVSVASIAARALKALKPPE